jgi:hypothetical protein
MPGLSLKWAGVLELREEFRRLPGRLRYEARVIVESTAQLAAADIRAAYPRRTGRLADSVVVQLRQRGPFGVVAHVRNTAPHAHIFEHGTTARLTRAGWPRGIMPAGNVFLPRIHRARGRMYAQLVALLEREGFTVSGEAA